MTAQISWIGRILLSRNWQALFKHWYTYTYASSDIQETSTREYRSQCKACCRFLTSRRDCALGFESYQWSCTCCTTEGSVLLCWKECNVLLLRAKLVVDLWISIIYILHGWLSIISASWGICIPPRTSWMYILGNINIVQDDSELQNIMDIKILWSSRRPSYNVMLKRGLIESVTVNIEIRPNIRHHTHHLHLHLH